MVINSVGAFETWGLNSKGDGFLREDLLKDYKTYEAFGEIYYRHGRYGHDRPFGRVIKAGYHPTLDLVVLFAILYKDRAYPEAIELLEKKELAGTSMGTQIEYDVCTICGHKAPTIAQHCDHVKYHLLEILDGPYLYDPQVGMLNKGNKFHDISLTPVPAWKASSVIAKVAEKNVFLFEERIKSGDIRDEAPAYKEAMISRAAEMEKDVVINPPAQIWDVLDKPELAMLAAQRSIPVQKLTHFSIPGFVDLFDTIVGIPTIQEIAVILAHTDGNAAAEYSLEHNTWDWVNEQINKITLDNLLSTAIKRQYNPRYYAIGLTEEEMADHSIWGPFLVRKAISLVNTPPLIIDKTIEGFLNGISTIEDAIDKNKEAEDSGKILLPLAAILGLKIMGIRRYLMLPALLKYGLPLALGAYLFSDPLKDIAKSLFLGQKYYDDYQEQALSSAPPSPVYNRPLVVAKSAEDYKTAGILRYILPPIGYYWYANYKYSRYVKGQGSRPTSTQLWALKHPAGTLVLGTLATATTYDILKKMFGKALKSSELDPIIVDEFRENPVEFLAKFPEENRGIILHDVLATHLK